MNPTDVIWPKSHLRLLKVVHDGVKTKTGFSVAEVLWDKKSTYGIRWDESPTKDGYPLGRKGKPQWMIVNPIMIKQMMSVLSSINLGGN